MKLYKKALESTLVTVPMCSSELLYQKFFKSLLENICADVLFEWSGSCPATLLEKDCTMYVSARIHQSFQACYFQKIIEPLLSWISGYRLTPQKLITSEKVVFEVHFFFQFQVPLLRYSIFNIFNYSINFEAMITIVTSWWELALDLGYILEFILSFEL